MNKLSNGTALILSAYLLNACGEGAVPFKDVETGRYEIKIGSGADAEDPSSSSFPIESGTSEMSDPSEYGEVVEAALKDDGTLADDDGDEDEENSSDAADDESSAKGASAAHESSTQDSENKKTASLCGKMFAGKAKKVVVVAASALNETLNLDAETVLAARLSGNQESLSLAISGIESMAGICILATGNQPKITIQSDINIGQLVYLARGNQSKGVITFTNDHKLESSFIELKGNGHALSFVGADAAHCENASVKGNGNHAVNCL